jgi:diaminopropionate ammonia-lyase
MLLLNTHAHHNLPLDPADRMALQPEESSRVEQYLDLWASHKPTPLHSLRGLARELGLEAIYIKDESFRLGLGSFKALGGSYAVIKLLVEQAEATLGRSIEVDELRCPTIRQIAGEMTFGCATDGNHGRSVAAGAQIVGAKAAIFVHSGVTDERVAAIAQFGAKIIRVEGTYDDSVAEAERVCNQNGWAVVSDTSWPGYERIPTLVMQGYTTMLREALCSLQQSPTHVFVQAGVGGLAASVAGYFDIVLGERRPRLVVVEPERAACIFQSARAGRRLRIPHDKPTIMAMLECFEPSLVAWRILSRKADAFMTVSETDAAEAMRALAKPNPGDPAIVAGESGGAGLAGLCRAMRIEHLRASLDLNATSRILLINTEGATDQARYEDIVGLAPKQVLPS